MAVPSSPGRPARRPVRGGGARFGRSRRGDRGGRSARRARCRGRPAVPGGDDARSARTPEIAPLPDVAGRDVVPRAAHRRGRSDPVAAARSVRTAAAACGRVRGQEQVDTTGSWIVLRVPVAGLDFASSTDLAGITGTVLSPLGPHRGRHRADRRPRQPLGDPAGQRHARAGAARAGHVDRRRVTVESELARREADLEVLQRPRRRAARPGRAFDRDRRAARHRRVPAADRRPPVSAPASARAGRAEVMGAVGLATAWASCCRSCRYSTVAAGGVGGGAAQAPEAGGPGSEGGV